MKIGTWKIMLLLAVIVTGILSISGNYFDMIWLNFLGAAIMIGFAVWIIVNRRDLK
ncbi:hypothetical protein [Listeria booriae]|uniref:hypothetical protein n=1 Tax=Listeria booriae TaxID=1552123 RepID=UPI00162526D3|nr:hypothetical protein [Listeria booriae]MBC1286899.1 hypothetical protein [Listeria booriae]MBC1306808.1 hypothetical protein [Listeria booriae]